MGHRRRPGIASCVAPGNFRKTSADSKDISDRPDEAGVNDSKAGAEASMQARFQVSLAPHERRD
jgi:hypothetical protein